MPTALYQMQLLCFLKASVHEDKCFIASMKQEIKTEMSVRCLLRPRLFVLSD